MRFRVLIPTAVSLMRAVISPFVAIAAIQQQWGYALLFVLFGAGTDFVDGLIARGLNAQSEVGTRWIDPVCDFVFGLGVLTGFIFHTSEYQLRLSVGLIMVMLAIVLKAAKEQTLWLRVKRYAYGLAPLYYIILTVWFMHFYLSMYLSSGSMQLVYKSALPIIVLLAWIRRGRFRAWFFHHNASSV